MVATRHSESYESGVARVAIAALISVLGYALRKAKKATNRCPSGAARQIIEIVQFVFVRDSIVATSRRSLPSTINTFFSFFLTTMLLGEMDVITKIARFILKSGCTFCLNASRSSRDIW